jgi:hypothetical protein
VTPARRLSGPLEPRGRLSRGGGRADAGVPMGRALLRVSARRFRRRPGWCSKAVTRRSRPGEQIIRAIAVKSTLLECLPGAIAGEDRAFLAQEVLELTDEELARKPGRATHLLHPVRRCHSGKCPGSPRHCWEGPTSCCPAARLSGSAEASRWMPPGGGSAAGVDAR